MIIAAFLLQAAQPSYPVEFSRWGEVQAHIYSGRALAEATRVTVYQADSRHGKYLIAKRVRTLRQEPETVAWADGRTCAALAVLPDGLNGLTALKLGKEAPLSRTLQDGSSEIVVTADGPTYEVEAPGEYTWDAGATVRLEAGHGPVAQWAARTLAALAPCWKERGPDPLPSAYNDGHWIWRPAVRTDPRRLSP